MKNTSNTIKKLLQFLYLPLIVFILIPIVAFLSLFIGAYIPTKFILIAVCFFLGGFALSKIESKTIKIISCVITSIIFILLGIYIAHYRDNSDASAMAAYIFMPITYFEDFFLTDETTLTNVLYVIFAPLPVIISGLSSLVFASKSKWSKITKIVIAVLLVGISVVTFGIELKDNYDHGNSLTGEKVTYFDLYGNEYKYADDVKFYDRDSNSYTLEDDTYLVDSNGNKKEICLDVFISADGYLYFDNDFSIHYREDIPEDVWTDWEWCDNDGNIYARIEYVSFLRNGTPYVDTGNEYRTK